MRMHDERLAGVRRHHSRGALCRFRPSWIDIRLRGSLEDEKVLAETKIDGIRPKPRIETIARIDTNLARDHRPSNVPVRQQHAVLPTAAFHRPNRDRRTECPHPGTSAAVWQQIKKRTVVSPSALLVRSVARRSNPTIARPTDGGGDSSPLESYSMAYVTNTDSETENSPPRIGVPPNPPTSAAIAWS